MQKYETSSKIPQINESVVIFFCSLLQVALGVSREFPYTPSENEWQALFQIAKQQCVMGVAYNAIHLLPQNARPPRIIAIKWSGAAEMIRGTNRLINEEAAHFTRLFAERGLRSTILKGPANARLYPDPLSRQVGDLDIWVPGGYEKLNRLLLDMKLISESIPASKLFHQIGFHSEKNILIEVHHRPVECLYRREKFYNVLTSELENITLTPEGFYSPNIRFALIMQLSHLYHHCVKEGVGLKQYMDYFILLKHSNGADRAFVWQQVQKFHLVHACAAIMWVLEKVFALPRDLMLCSPDPKRGLLLYNQTILGGNFGRFNPTRTEKRFILSRWFKDRMKSLKWIPFDPLNGFLRESLYWKNTFLLIPERIRRKKLGL